MLYVGSVPIENKIHKNPYLCAINKIIVATITVPSCINLTYGNC
jgi:hypothetical protein